MIVLLLFMLPHLSLSQNAEATALINECKSDDECRNGVNLIKTTVNTDFILEICQSLQNGADRACFVINEKALELNLELPIDYLKKECFGGSSSLRRICTEIGNLCSKHPKSDSCSKIIPKQSVASTVNEILSKCPKDAVLAFCENAARSRSNIVTADEIKEICKTEKEGSRGCHQIIMETVPKIKITAGYWKKLCGSGSGEDHKFCEEVVSACNSVANGECDEIKKAHKEIATNAEKSDSTLVFIIAGCVVGAVIFLGGIVFFFRKKIFKSRYSKKQGTKGTIDKKNEKQGKIPGTAANLEVENALGPAQKAPSDPKEGSAPPAPTDSKDDHKEEQKDELLNFPAEPEAK